MADPIHILDPDGTLVGDPPVDLEETRRMYAAMVAARVYDRKCSAMQRQGRLATYAPFEGQEAAQIGATAALRPDDWLVATYRDAAAMWMQGYTWRNLILGRTGDERGGQAPEGINVMPPSITVGAHMIHAVGMGWAEVIRGTDRIAMTMFGDGATSEGDFHEAMNFAGVFQTPTVFLCQNNGYAISMARHNQTAAETIASKAVGYGMPGLLVDGNDVLAVRAVADTAVAQARAGEGPTLIEALTYRMGPHTTTDDPNRYRHEQEVEEWRTRDPLERVQRYLEASDAWSPDWQADLEETESELVERAVLEAEALEAFAPGQIFEAMFADMTPELQRQRSEAEGSR